MRIKNKSIFCFNLIFFSFICFLIFTNTPSISQNYDNYIEPGWDLLYAADDGDIATVRSLIDQGVDPNFKNHEGVTAIILASQFGYDDIVEFLIKSGADVNKKSDYYGITPLISAVRNNYLRTAETLIRSGAKINDNDNWGRQAIHYSAMYNYFATTDMLIYYFADIDDKDAYGNTPLMYAVANNNDSIAELLISNNADLMAINDQKNSLFHIAAFSGNKFFISNYLENYEDKNLINENGFNPLEKAIIHGYDEIVEFLLDKDFTLRDTINNIYTPLTLAKFSRNNKTKRLFKEMDIKDIHYTYFNRMGIGFETLFNSNDYFLSFNFNLTEDRYGFIASLGFLTRLFPKSVYIPKSANEFYYVDEKRYAIYSKIQKHFKLIHLNNFYLSVYPQLRPIYFWGDYLGIEKKVTNEIIISSGAGISLNFGHSFRLNFNYEYCDINIYNVKPHMYNIGIKFLFSYRKKEKNEKYKYIINY